MKKAKRRFLTGILCVVLFMADVMSTVMLASAVNLSVEQENNIGENGIDEDGEKNSSGGDIELGTKDDDTTDADGEVGADLSDSSDSGMEGAKDDEEGNYTENGNEENEDRDGVEESNGEDLIGNAEERLALMVSTDDIASGTYRDLVWVIDANGKLTVEGAYDLDFGPNQYYLPWRSYKTSIISVEFNVTGFTDVNYLFGGYSNLKSLDLSGFDTSKVTNMSEMFSECINLTNLNLSGFDTSKVTDMSHMFYRCESLTSLDVSNFDTSKVTNMESMFYKCYNLISLNLSNFSTSNVTDMSSMFYYCRSLTKLDVENLDTGEVTDMSHMFNNCQNLISFDVSNFDTENVIDMDRMFYNCKSLSSLDVSGFNTSNVTNMNMMFQYCESLTSLEVGKFNTSNVLDMYAMFQNCTSLINLDVSNFDTSNVKSMRNIFYGCSNLASLDVSNFDTSNITDMSGMFSGCYNLTSLNVSNFDTSNVTDMGGMFSGCNSLTSLGISGFHTANVTNLSGMFSNCRSLTSIDVSNFNTSKVMNMSRMFSGCYNLKSLDVSNFNTSNVVDMSYMFQLCKNLTNLKLSNFVTNNVENIDGIVTENKLTELDLSGFNLSKAVCETLDGWWTIGGHDLSTVYTPCNLQYSILLPTSYRNGILDVWYRSDGSTVTELPQNLSYSVALGKNYIPEEKIPEKETLESPIIELKDGERAVFVYDESTNLPIEGAIVTIDGNSYPTDSEGVSRFVASDESVKKQIQVSASGYNGTTTYQQIKSKNLVRIGITSILDTLQIVSAGASLKGENYDVLREKLVLGYADDFTSKAQDTLNLTIKSNKENVIYEILVASRNWIEGGNDSGGTGFSLNVADNAYDGDNSNGAGFARGGVIDDSDIKILYTSKDGKFSIDVTTEIVKVGDIEIAKTAVTNLIEPGKKLLVRITDEEGNSIVKMLNISSTYNYLTQENTSQKDNFKLGDELRVSVPDDVPFIGGNDYVFGFDDKMPVEVEIDEDGKIKISYNKPADVDMDKFSKAYKDLEKKAGRVAKLNSNIAGTKKFSAGMIDVSGKVCGYGEGNISEIMNGNPDIKLGIMAEIEGKAGYKHYWVIGFVPVKLFIEGKVAGDVTFEAEMKFQNWKIKELDISGGSFNVTIQIEVGGGVGFGYEVEASMVGKINYTNKPARKYEKLWLEASGKVKRVIIGIWEKIFWESDAYKYTLYQKGSDTPQPFSYALMQEMGDETSELSLMGRDYLNYTDGYNASNNKKGIVTYDTKAANSIIKKAVFPTASPTLVETVNGKYLFWIDDITSRDEYNRASLMYSKSSDGVNWSTPKQIIDESKDNTLDGSYDVFVDGSMVYLTWQDATRQLTEEDNVLDILKSLSISYAVLDTEEDTVTENKVLTSESGYYMYPCTVAAGNEIYSAYAQNMLDTDDIDGNNTQHLYVVTNNDESKEVSIPDKAQIVNMDAGIFDGRTSLVCELDTDGNSTTDEDREIYIYDFQSGNMTQITNNGLIDTMPVIADSGNIYWFQNTDIVKLISTEKAPESIWDGQQMAYQTVFTVATDTSGKDIILWESTDKDAEDGSIAIFQTSENDDGTWGNVVKFAETTGTIASRISAAGNGDGLQVAHTEGVYLSDGTALKDLCVTARENVTDIAVEYVDFDEISAVVGAPLMLKTEIVNNGNTTVNEVTVNVNNTVITTLTGLNLKPSESRELEISGFSVPTTLKESTYFTLNMSTSGESRQENNTVDFLLGCPDVYVETDCRIAGERTWLDISIWNNNTYETSGKLIVHKSTENGEVIYSKTYNGLDANNGYAYSVDLGNYEDKNVKYYVEITADNEESSLGNNTEFVYIGYGTGIEEENGSHEVKEVNAISLNVKAISLGIGETSQLIAKDDQGNTFEMGELLWSSSDNRIASVDQTGLVKAHRLGQAEITVYYGKLCYSCNVTVGGESETKKLTVWFDTQGGDEIAPITEIISGSAITLPTNVRKLGYIFEGWYTQPIGGEKIEDSTLFVEHSMTLYAHWISEQSESGMWIEGIADQIYTGKAIKPQVKVYDGTKLLKEKTDYTISYKNNIKANDATNIKNAPTVIVTGKGNYSRKETITFRILPIDLNDTSVITSDITVAYTGKLQKKVPTLVYNGKKLTNKKDFTVSYPDLENGVPDAYKAAGTYDILLTAKDGGNFTGTRTVKHTITDSILISKAKVSKIPAQYYLGIAMEPYFTVTYNDATLVENEDYTFTYENNIAPGKAAIILTGIGDYVGTKKVYFTIKGPAFKNVKVDGIENKVYNGSKQEQQISVRLDNISLTEGVDYEVEYSNNQNAGKATITIKGINAYSGTAKKTFKITAYDIKTNELSELIGFENEITAKYTKGGAKPKLTLTFAGKELVEGKDYTISYKNNKAVTTEETQKLPIMTIKGKGNFKGILSKTFTITSKALNDEGAPVTLTVVDKGFVNKAGKYISKPTLTDSDGKKLIAGKDYKKEIIYSLEDGTPLTNESIVETGTNIKVKVIGKGTYYGELEKTYRITEYDFSKAKVKITPKVYTGSPITLDKDDIAVRIGNDTLTYGIDYEIIENSYTNNKNKGTASVTIIGKGSYGGMKISKFKITTKGFVWFWRML